MLPTSKKWNNKSPLSSRILKTCQLPQYSWQMLSNMFQNLQHFEAMLSDTQELISVLQILYNCKCVYINFLKIPKNQHLVLDIPFLVEYKRYLFYIMFLLFLLIFNSEFFFKCPYFLNDAQIWAEYSSWESTISRQYGRLCKNRRYGQSKSTTFP